MRVNWADFDEKGFKDGVTQPFVKYLSWIGALLHFYFSLLAYKYYTEDTEGKQDEPGEPIPSTATAPTPSVPPPPTALPTALPASKQPGKYKKRALIDTEESSKDEEDVDMEIQSNDSSGSSMDSDHVPTKRLWTSTIVTHSSRATPASEQTITKSNTGHSFSNLGHPNTEPETASEHGTATGPETKPETEPEAGTEPEAEAEPGVIDADTNVSSSCLGLIKDAATSTTPTSQHSPTTDMDVDESSVSIRHAHKPTNAAVAPPQPLSAPAPNSDLESEIPDFLVGKNDIHGYLSCVKEPGFHALLKNYIKFEHANNSHIRGMFPTGYRPNAIGWWTGCARPSRLPPFDSLKSFADGIVTWWISLQPAWRKIQPGQTSCVGGNWECLYQPGINGLLNIVILAHWWARILEERDNAVDDRYSWFISDFTWVLTQLTLAAHKGIF